MSREFPLQYEKSARAILNKTDLKSSLTLSHYELVWVLNVSKQHLVKYEIWDFHPNQWDHREQLSLTNIC